MPDHEQFQMMCALAATDQLQGEERRLLEKHTESCCECAADLEDFRAIIAQLKREELPQENTSEASEDCDFTKFARQSGIRFSRAAEQELTGKATYKLGWRTWTVTVGASTVLLAILAYASAYSLMKTPAIIPVARLVPVSIPAATGGTEGLIQVERQGTDDTLERERAKFTTVAAERDRLKAELAERDATIGRLQNDIASANKQHLFDVAALESFNQKSDSIKADLIAANVRENELREQIQVKQEAIEQERQLTAAAKDVRDLMGARRLFMIDVYDGEDIEHSHRSFGRIFYTQGKSLIFYAFDLDKDHGIKRVTFKAWGQKGKDRGSIKSLGVFHIDDATQKRWVMKVDDPRKLAGIDAIFVTVESSPETDRPSGQKLMYAYLGGQPNHP